MILAAGLGTRLKPFTDKHPKALAMVNDKTILQLTIEHLHKAGIKEVIINVHHFAEQIINHLKENNNFGVTISISDETDEVLETGGGLKKCSWFFENNSDFILINVDILTNLNLNEMIVFHQKEKPLATLAVSNRQSTRCLLFDNENRLCGWKNKKTGEEKVMIQHKNLIEKSFSGIHIINSKIFSLMHQTGKFSMIDVYLDLAQTNVIKAFDHSNDIIIDVGKPESLLEAAKYFN